MPVGMHYQSFLTIMCFSEVSSHRWLKPSWYRISLCSRKCFNGVSRVTGPSARQTHGALTETRHFIIIRWFRTVLTDAHKATRRSIDILHPVLYKDRERRTSLCTSSWFTVTHQVICSRLQASNNFISNPTSSSRAWPRWVFGHSLDPFWNSCPRHSLRLACSSFGLHVCEILYVV